jgi:hypothetical protein
MEEEMVTIGSETYQDPTVIAFRNLLNFFGTVTVGLGPGMKPLSETFECSYPDYEDSQLTTVKLDFPLGMAFEESGNVAGRFEIYEVEPGSNAEAAGLKPGDLIRATTAVSYNKMIKDPDLAMEASTKLQRCLFVADDQSFEAFVTAALSNKEEDGGPDEITLVIERYDALGKKKKAAAAAI